MHALRISLIALAIVAVPLAADARPRPGGQLGGRRFEANKTFGMGLELGAPTGLTGKYFFAADHAIDFGIGDVYNYFDRSGLHIYADYLAHPVSLVSAEPFELPLYIGVGGRFWSFDNRVGNGTTNSATAFGVRVPIGVAFGSSGRFSTAARVATFSHSRPIVGSFSAFKWCLTSTVLLVSLIRSPPAQAAPRRR